MGCFRRAVPVRLAGCRARLAGSQGRPRMPHLFLNLHKGAGDGPGAPNPRAQPASASFGGSARGLKKLPGGSTRPSTPAEAGPTTRQPAAWLTVLRLLTARLPAVASPSPRSVAHLTNQAIACPCRVSGPFGSDNEQFRPQHVSLISHLATGGKPARVATRCLSPNWSHRTRRREGGDDASPARSQWPRMATPRPGARCCAGVAVTRRSTGVRHGFC